MGAILNFLKCIALIQLLGDNENYEVVGDSDSIGGKINLNDTLAAVIAILIIVLVSLICIIWLLIKRRRYIKIVETALDEKKKADTEYNTQQSQAGQNSQAGIAQQNGESINSQGGVTPGIVGEGQGVQVATLNQPSAQSLAQTQAGTTTESANVTPVNYGVNGNNASNLNENVENAVGQVSNQNVVSNTVGQASTPNTIVDHTAQVDNQNITTPIEQVQSQNATNFNNQLINQVETNTFNQVANQNNVAPVEQLSNQNNVAPVEQLSNQNISNSTERVSNANVLNGVQAENTASVQANQNQGGTTLVNSQQASEASGTIQYNQPIENLNTDSSYQGQGIAKNNFTGVENVHGQQQGVLPIVGASVNGNINNENNSLIANQPFGGNSGDAVNNKPKASWPGKV